MTDREQARTEAASMTDDEVVEALGRSSLDNPVHDILVEDVKDRLDTSLDTLSAGGLLNRLLVDAEAMGGRINEVDASAETKRKLVEACAAVREAVMLKDVDTFESRRRG